MFLHGCTTAGCLKVWPPEDKEDVCESCGNTRFDEAGNPREFVIWFPLKTRFTSLLCLPQYHEACKHEGKRRKNDGYMTGIYLFSVCSQHYNLFLYVYMFADIYDSPAWQEKMGPVVRRDDGEVCVTRLGLLFCTDGFPAFNQKRKGAISLLPAEFINLSHGPHIRYDPDNVMIYFLIPNHYSAETQRKYYKYVTKVELNPLQRDGVPGPDGPVKIKVFCASLDLKGKENSTIKLLSEVIWDAQHVLFTSTKDRVVLSTRYQDDIFLQIIHSDHVLVFSRDICSNFATTKPGTYHQSRQRRRCSSTQHLHNNLELNIIWVKRAS